MPDPFPSPPPLQWAQRSAAFALPPGVMYLDGAAKSPRLRHTLDAAHTLLEAEVNPRWLPYASFLRHLEATRALAADLLFEADVDGLAMVPSAAHGVATAARNLPLQRGERVLVLDGQFPSNLLAWQQRCGEVGAHLAVVKPREGESITVAVLRTLADTPRVAIAALPHCHWHDGQLLDLDAIAVAVQDRRAALVLDLSQSLGVLPVQLTRWRPDFIVSVGYKWLLGTSGLAWFWGSPRWRCEGVPLEQHWGARDPGPDWAYPMDAAPPYLSGARRFDAGGVADPLRLAMTCGGLAQLEAWGLARVASALGEVTNALDAALEARGLSAWKTAGHAPHLTGLRVPADRLDAVAAAFAERGILCSRKPACLRLAPCLAVEAGQMEEVVEIAASARL